MGSLANVIAKLYKVYNTSVGSLAKVIAKLYKDYNTSEGSLAKVIAIKPLQYICGGFARV